jgi:hypothetical protein
MLQPALIKTRTRGVTPQVPEGSVKSSRKDFRLLQLMIVLWSIAVLATLSVSRLV